MIINSGVIAMSNKMSKEQYEKYINEQQNQVMDVRQKVKEIVPTLFTKKHFSSFLTFMSKWSHYSCSNIILLYAQIPHARYLAGFNTWKEYSLSMGNSEFYEIIKKNEKGKGITLLLPFTKKSFYQKESDTYREYSLAYQTALIFDISQTNNIIPPKKLPPNVSLETLSYKAFSECFRWHHDKNISLILSNDFIPDSLNSRHHKKVIYIRDSLADRERIKAVIEELVIMTSNQCYGKDSDNKIKRAAAYSVLNFFHFPVKEYSFPYFEIMQDNPVEELFDILNKIYVILKIVINELNNIIYDFSYIVRSSPEFQILHPKEQIPESYSFRFQLDFEETTIFMQNFNRNRDIFLERLDNILNHTNDEYLVVSITGLKNKILELSQEQYIYIINYVSKHNIISTNGLSCDLP